MLIPFDASRKVFARVPLNIGELSFATDAEVPWRDHGIEQKLIEQLYRQYRISHIDATAESKEKRKKS